MFSVNNLRTGAFSQLPPAHIEGLLRRFTRIPAKRGQAIVREGEIGDFYYVIETGKCQVERTVGGAHIKLAQLKAGDAFGEEALVSGTKRNATVTMISDGALFRLDQKDFNELLREPLLQTVTMAEAQAKVAGGAQWLDVRYPSEFQFDKLPGAVNIPVAEIRDAARLLDQEREYVVYCQSGRRSSAAAFLLAQRGYKAFLLQGGLWGGERRGAGSPR
jgi:rhodanese-related sulfurtransferase